MTQLLKRLIFPQFLLLIAIVGLYLLSFTNWFQIHKIWILSDFHLYIIFSAWTISSCFYFYEVQKNTLLEQSFIVIASEKEIDEKEIQITALLSEFDFEKFENEFGVFYSRESITGSQQNIVIYFDEIEYLIYVKLNWLDYLSGRGVLEKFKDKLSPGLSNTI